MWLAILAMMLSVALPAPFGDAEATALVVAQDGSAVLEVTVEVFGVPAAVLVRGVGPLDELPPVALAPRGDGTYSGIVQLTTTIGVYLAFEYIPAGGGTPFITDVSTLIQLGVDPAALTVAPLVVPTLAPSISVAPDPAVGDGPPWGWIALAASVAFLSLLVTWLWMGRAESVDGQPGKADYPTNAEDETKTGSGGAVP